MDFIRLNSIIHGQSADMSVILKDLTYNKVLFSHNTQQRMRSASIIKLFILKKKCAEAFKQGEIYPEREVSVNEVDQVEFSLITDLSARSWRLDDIATLMIILSDNTATNIMINILGMCSINRFISNSGFSDTLLQRKMMDIESAKSGLDNYTSLKDASTLLEHLHKSAENQDPWSLWMKTILSKQKDRSMLGRYLPESIALSNKTGLNDGVQHDIGFF